MSAYVSRPRPFTKHASLGLDFVFLQFIHIRPTTGDGEHGVLNYVIMTSLILCLLLSGAIAPLSNKHNINDVKMTRQSQHVTIGSFSL